MIYDLCALPLFEYSQAKVPFSPFLAICLAHLCNSLFDNGIPPIFLFPSLPFSAFPLTHHINPIFPSICFIILPFFSHSLRLRMDPNCCNILMAIDGDKHNDWECNEPANELAMLGQWHRQKLANWPEKMAEGGGTVEVGSRRVPIQQMHHILASRFCFVSGLKTGDGHPVLTFPDSRTLVSFEEYQLLVDYIIQINRLETISPVVEHRPRRGHSLLDNNIGANGSGGFVVVVDRRLDKWSAVRTLFSYLMNYFPEPLHLVLLLKPEGVLQRAIEYGYRGLLDSNDKFKVIICQSCAELHEFVGRESLTMDVGGVLKHNHLEWAEHRMDIERMKSSAGIIAESLSEFGKCLRETELPNDVQTTERILELQQQERDAIKEDFRISIRKGMALLRQVRQMERSPHSDQLAPSRLQNVTAIERMIIQLQDTEHSFDTFWQKHRQRLMGCLELRRFEDEFRKLQNQFAKHMLHLEEHREVGNNESNADRLAREHAEYGADTVNDVVQPCRCLRERGLALSARGDLSELLNCTQGSDSVGPKCEELGRMADALEGALERRSHVLELSRRMHSQIGKANDWCRRGVELLSVAPLDLLSAGCSNNLAIYEHATARLEQFLAEGDCLKMDALKESCTVTNSSAPSNDGLIMLTTTETSSLLTQVSKRIEDIHRLSRARHDALKKLAEEKARKEREKEEKPILVVTPEKASMTKHNNNNKHNHHRHNHQQPHPHQMGHPNGCCSSSCSSSPSSSSTNCCCAVADHRMSHSSSSVELISNSALSVDQKEEMPTKVNYVLEELLNTERSYVRELAEILTHYVQPFEALELSGSGLLPSALRGQGDILFGNIRDLVDFHQTLLLPALHHSANSVHGVSAVLNTQRQRLLILYRTYCRNKPISEALRAEHAVDQCKFFAECQRRAGHLLPLSAYLLKPVQRITKYQLLLKELIRHCSDADQSQSVQSALASMLDVLAQINADMEHLHILGYPGDLRLLGALRLRTECEVYSFKRAKSGISNGSSGSGGPSRRNGTKGKHQKRHLFLFDGGVLFCKKRMQAAHITSEYYEHKLFIPMPSLGFAECSRQSDERFELWDLHDSVNYAIQTVEEKARHKWVQRLARLTILHQRQKMAEAAREGASMEPPQQKSSVDHKNGNKSGRPQSWTTTSSSEDGMIGIVGGGGRSSSGVLSSRSSTSSSSSSAFEQKGTPTVDEHDPIDDHQKMMSASSSYPQQHCAVVDDPIDELNCSMRSQSQPPFSSFDIDPPE